MKIQPGDIIGRREGVYTHVGVVLNDFSVFQNTKERGEHLTGIVEFSGGQKLSIRNQEYGIPRGKSVSPFDIRPSGKAYDWISNNCDHTVTRILTGIPFSPQLRLAFLIAGAFVVVSFVAAKRRL